MDKELMRLATIILAFCTLLPAQVMQQGIVHTKVPVVASGPVPTYVQSKALNGSPSTVTYTNAVTATNLLVACVNGTSTGITTPTSTGETWLDSGQGEVAYTSSSAAVKCFYVANNAGHAAGYAVTNTCTSLCAAMHIYEFSNVATTTPVDTGNKAINATSSSGSNNESAGSVTTSGADLLFAFFGTLNGPLTAGTNVAWSSPTGDVQGLSEYFVQSGSGATIGNCTTGYGAGDTYGGIVIAFKPKP